MKLFAQDALRRKMMDPIPIDGSLPDFCRRILVPDDMFKQLDFAPWRKIIGQRPSGLF